MKILNSKPESYQMKTVNEEFENGINPNLPTEPLECEIKVSLQPLRINIDQVIYSKIFILLSDFFVFRIHLYL